MYTKRYLQTSSNEMVEELRELERAIKMRTTYDNGTDLKGLSSKVYNKWDEMRRIWSIIVLHEELDVISVSLIALQTNIRTGEYNRALEQIDRAIFLLEDLVEKERVTIRNVL